MFYKTERHSGEDFVLFVNTTGVTIEAGSPVLAGGRMGIPSQPILAGQSDMVCVRDNFRAAKAAEAWSAGDEIGWDSNGNPAVGVAGSGCYTKTKANWDSGYLAGIAAQDAASGDEYGILALNEFTNAQVVGGFIPQAHIADVAAVTYAAPTNGSAAITDSTGGTASVTHTVVAPASTDYTATELKNNFATLAAEYNTLRTAVGNAITALAALATDSGANRTKINALLASLESAAVLASS